MALYVHNLKEKKQKVLNHDYKTSVKPVDYKYVIQ